MPTEMTSSVAFITQNIDCLVGLGQQAVTTTLTYEKYLSKRSSVYLCFGLHHLLRDTSGCSAAKRSTYCLLLIAYSGLVRNG